MRGGEGGNGCGLDDSDCESLGPSSYAFPFFNCPCLPPSPHLTLSASQVADDGSEHQHRLSIIADKSVQAYVTKCMVEAFQKGGMDVSVYALPSWMGEEGRGTGEAWRGWVCGV